MKIYYAIILSASVMLWFLLGCARKEEKENSSRELGKYVYIDSQGVLHTRKHCFGLEITTSNGEKSFYKSIKFIEKYKVTNSMLESMCSWCVGDEQYEELKRITEGNGSSKGRGY